jgi:hypothetical protein
MTQPGSTLQVIDSDFPFDEGEIAKCIIGLSPTSSEGPDGIPARLLKLAPFQFARLLKVIFDFSIETGKLPVDWKRANVVPIFKGGDRSVPSNYRPISLTSVCCKVMERLIETRIRAYLESNDLLNSTQHGFRKGHSCTSQLCTFHYDVAGAIDANRQVDAFLIDFAKAFDKVPHGKLVTKLQNCGIHLTYIKWIIDFLLDRQQRVKVGGTLSDPIAVTSGVPQGSVLGPLLFLVYINDISTHLNCKVRLFADDCIVYTQIDALSDCLLLQRDILSIIDWCNSWGMCLNRQKCYKISFTTKRSPRSFPYEFDDGSLVNTVDTCKYLGVNMQSNMQWNLHIDKTVKKAFNALSFLRRNFRKSSQSIKSLLYFTTVRPILEYAAVVWEPYRIGQKKSLERVQRRAARFVTNTYDRTVSVSSLMSQLGWNSLEERRCKARLKCFYNVFNNLGGWSDLSTHLREPAFRGRRDHCFKVYIPMAKKDFYKYSFFVRTCRDWNSLPNQFFDNGMPSSLIFNSNIAD